MILRTETKVVGSWNHRAGGLAENEMEMGNDNSLRYEDMDDLG